MSERRRLLKEIDCKRRSKLFMLPILDVHIPHDSKYLIDVNIQTGGFPQIITIFDNIDDEELKMLIYKLQSGYQFIDCNYGDDDKEIVLFFDIQKEFQLDFELFTQGGYSRFSEKYKNRLLDYYDRGTCSTYAQFSMFDALYPTEKKRKERAEDLGYNKWEDIKELFSVPDLETEEYKTIDELNKWWYDRRGENISNIK